VSIHYDIGWSVIILTIDEYCTFVCVNFHPIILCDNFRLEMESMDLKEQFLQLQAQQQQKLLERRKKKEEANKSKVGMGDNKTGYFSSSNDDLGLKVMFCSLFFFLFFAFTSYELW
jgi:hypothetical protein